MLLPVTLGILISVSSLRVGFAGAPPLHQIENETARGPIAAIVEAALERARAKTPIPSLAVGVSFHGRHYFVQYGALDSSGEHFRPDTIVEIGSCTKVFTTTLFAEAVQSGSMRLNDSVKAYIPKGTKLRDRA
jgi:CubicO group peptidase (beta-lactamase class C family)